VCVCVCVCVCTIYNISYHNNKNPLKHEMYQETENYCVQLSAKERLFSVPSPVLYY